MYVSRLIIQGNEDKLLNLIRSSPNEKSTRLAATATAAPLEDPPGTFAGVVGLVGVP